jgi:type IV secretory pathway TrbL component
VSCKVKQRHVELARCECRRVADRGILLATAHVDAPDKLELVSDAHVIGIRITHLVMAVAVAVAVAAVMVVSVSIMITMLVLVLLLGVGVGASSVVLLSVLAERASAATAVVVVAERQLSTYKRLLRIQ